MKVTHEAVQRNNEALMKKFENQIEQMAKKISNQSTRGFPGSTTDNPKNESCKAVELRSKKVLTPDTPKVTNDKVIESVEEEEMVDENNENGGVEHESEVEKSYGEKIEKVNNKEEKGGKLIDVDSILRQIK